jgi:hypothetical protein
MLISNAGKSSFSPAMACPVLSLRQAASCAYSGRHGTTTITPIRRHAPDNDTPPARQHSRGLGPTPTHPARMLCCSAVPNNAAAIATVQNSQTLNRPQIIHFKQLNAIARHQQCECADAQTQHTLAGSLLLHRLVQCCHYVTLQVARVWVIARSPRQPQHADMHLTRQTPRARQHSKSTMGLTPHPTTTPHHTPLPAACCSAVPNDAAATARVQGGACLNSNARKCSHQDTHTHTTCTR